MKHFLQFIWNYKNVSQVGGPATNSSTPLHSETTKTTFFFDETKAIKNTKAMKQSHTYKSYASTYDVEILKFLSWTMA